MFSPAFIVNPTFRANPGRSHSLSARTAKRCPSRPRIFLSGEKLYPDVDPPEPIPNPLDQNSRSAASNDDNEPFLKKLNDRTAQRRATDVNAAPLDPSTAAAELNAYKVEDIMDSPPDTPSPTQQEPPELKYTKAAKALWRLGWFSWWVQLVLSVISAVILLFSFAFPGVNVRSSASLFGFIFSGVGVLIAFVSLFWTYSYTRLSLWLQQGKGTTEQARSRISGKLRFGVIFSIMGLLVSLIGLQAIVGTLLARLFGAGIATTPYTAYQAGAAGSAGGLVPGLGIVQPVDVLVVQASANAMTALMTALMTTSWLRSREKSWNEKAST